MTSWIRNNGVKPVGDTIRVEVSLANGTRENQVASFFRWDLDDEDESNIAWYRVWSEQSLETAYDVPPKPYSLGALTKKQIDEFVAKLSCNPEHYKAPITKAIATNVAVKKSVAELVSENFNTLAGKNITPQEVVQIVELFKLLSSMEN